MKKTVRVSLGGIAYTLEDDAFALLENYINTLKARLGVSTEGSETLRDIEERIAELFTEKMGNAEVVGIDLVKLVIATIGNPEQIAGDGEEAERPTYAQHGLKRLYRNPENAVIAGVCSGLSEYFATDPVVIRIIMIALFFAKGFGLLLYLILWIAVPRALTPRQKLEMRGEPINLSNLRKTVKDEYRQVNENLNKSGLANALERVVNFIGRVAYWLVQVLLVFVKAIAIVIGVAIILTMLVAFLAIINAIFFGGVILHGYFPAVHGISLGELVSSMFEFGSSAWVTIPVFLIIIIPILTLLYFGFRILFRFKARDGLIGLIAAVVWVFAVVTLSVMVFYQAKSFSIREKVTDTITLNSKVKPGATLYIEAGERPDSLYFLPSNLLEIDDYSLTIVDGKTLIQGRPKLTIERGRGEYPELTIVKKARGGSLRSAREKAASIVYNYMLKDSLLRFDPYFSLPLGEKWKIQEVNLTLRVPQNYYIYLDRNMEELLDVNQPDCDCWPDEMVGKKWVMKEYGLKEAW
jgi:phage shock protein PspC (stress-responsive transcriptional regulator)